MPNRRSNHGSVTCCDEHKNSMPHFNGNVSCSSPKEDNLATNLVCLVSGKVIDADSLSCVFHAPEFSEDVSVIGCCSDRSTHELTHKIEDCSFET